MDLYDVQNSQPFDGLVRDLEILLKPKAGLWQLSNIIQPVSLVNSQVTLNALLGESIESLATEGEKVTPATSTVFADTGNLAAGNYKCRVYISCVDATTSPKIIVQHRNEPDTANIWSMTFYTSSAIAAQDFYFEFARDFALNESLRVINSGAGTGGTYQAIIFYRSFT